MDKKVTLTFKCQGQIQYSNKKICYTEFTSVYGLLKYIYSYDISNVILLGVFKQFFL